MPPIADEPIMPGEDERHDLYELYYNPLVRYLVKRWNFTSDEARDLAQDVFVSVFKRMEHTTVVAMWPFLKTAAHHRAVNAIRTRAIHRRTEAGSLDAMPELDATALRDIWTDETPKTPEGEAIQHEQRVQLREAIDSLSAPLRTCMLLRMSGQPYEEIAAILNVTPNAVKTRLRDAKKLLLARLGRGD
ncbi:MAG: RNA polymerase sigma factor [Thermoanaerobaculia bacterium]